MTYRQSKHPARPKDPARSGGDGQPMMLELVLLQMHARTQSPEPARETAYLAFIQWLGALPGGCDYAAAARAALERVSGISASSPALTIFCTLLADSLDRPARPLDLRLPSPCRRGGTRARRLSL